MSHPAHAHDAHGRRRSAAVVAGVALAVVGALLGCAFWILRAGQSAEHGAGSGVLATPADGRNGVAGFDAPAAPGSPPAPDVPHATPAPAAPLPAPRAAVADAGREVRGLAVRASDESPVASVTVIALARDRDAGTEAWAELSRARTNADGAFTLRVPLVDAFRVLVPGSVAARAGAGIGGVPVRVEWANDDPAATAVRLVLETGWRLDVRVVDAQGSLGAGVVVKGGGRTATTDDEGRCTLLDLPADQESLTLTLQAKGGARAKHVVPVPPAGELRQDVKLTVP